MTAKDSSLFEARKHNDFSALLSSDEEDASVIEVLGSEDASHKNGLHAATNASGAANLEEDGFETFSTSKKSGKTLHRQGHANKSFPPRSLNKTSTSSSAIPFPKELIVPKLENSIELLEFPSTYKTADLRKFLQQYEGHYRLKWNNDTSCYVVFDDNSLVEKSLSELKDEVIKVRSYVEQPAAPVSAVEEAQN